MKILALEFSSPQRTAAVVEGPGSGPSISPGSPVPQCSSPVAPAGSPAIHALSLIDDALRKAGLEREQIECLAVGLGPGSYTGIRAAIALAQGWQLARGIKLLGVSSVECLAAEAQMAGLRGRVAVAIDAQRNEFYLATYEITALGRQAIDPLRLASLAEVQACRQAGQVLIGPDVEKWFPDVRVVFAGAATLGRLASMRTDFVSGEKLEPIYLRQTTFIKAPPRRQYAS
jgi:tRNA threonylcarbamoyl adenosine modification protein YeaZ